jgi:hypothetical protein
MLLGATSFAAAQILPSSNSSSTDVLGAHLNYGRGCAACHAPHSGAFGNGYKPTQDIANTGANALWGQDVSNLLGKTLVTGMMDMGRSYSISLPASITDSYTSYTTGSSGATTVTSDPTVTGVLMCLSCHDGNYATGSMMQKVIYETLTGTGYGTNAAAIPTLLGNDGTGLGNYLNDHPIGQSAKMGCGAPYNWDCTISGGTVSMTGTNSAQFVKNYGFFVSPGSYTTYPTATGSSAATTVPIVVCTTCHNQHVMNVVNVNSANSGQPAGFYTTMFFLRGPYNPNTTTAKSNQDAQFCRQCHGGEGNESNGALNVATTY